MKDTIENIEIVTCGRGIEVRIGGTSINEGINQYGCKTRREFLIGDGFKSKDEAREFTIKWLESQLSRMKEPTK